MKKLRSNLKKEEIAGSKGYMKWYRTFDNEIRLLQEFKENLEIISRTVEGAMNEMSLGINEITIAAHHVSDMANSTRENIDVLDKLLDKFKL